MKYFIFAMLLHVSLAQNATGSDYKGDFYAMFWNGYDNVASGPFKMALFAIFPANMSIKNIYSFEQISLEIPTFWCVQI